MAWDYSDTTRTGVAEWLEVNGCKAQRSHGIWSLLHVKLFCNFRNYINVHMQYLTFMWYFLCMRQCSYLFTYINSIFPSQGKTVKIKTIVNLILQMRMGRVVKLPSQSSWRMQPGFSLSSTQVCAGNHGVTPTFAALFTTLLLVWAEIGNKWNSLIKYFLVPSYLFSRMNIHIS